MQIAKPVDRAEAFGRIAFSCPHTEVRVFDLLNLMRSLKSNIHLIKNLYFIQKDITYSLSWLLHSSFALGDYR